MRKESRKKLLSSKNSLHKRRKYCDFKPRQQKLAKKLMKNAAKKPSPQKIEIKNLENLQRLSTRASWIFWN